MNPETLIRSTQGRLFSVQFIKRSTGELRQMTARVGVTRYLSGGPRAYNPADYNLITVFEVTPREPGGYKSIPLDAILSITFRGHHDFTQQRRG